MKRLNRIYLRHSKNTADQDTVRLPLPRTVSISMAQTLGAPCEPLVQEGDKVLVGQKIGDTDAYVSAPVHSSVSGTVLGLTDYLMPSGKVCKTVLIQPDGKQTVSPDVAPPDFKEKKGFIKAVRESGACGLGGAGFPTHVKLDFDPKKTPIDTLVVNAAECEPYITSDYRELMEYLDDVYQGIRMLLYVLDIPRAKLCIESNKPAAIQRLRGLIVPGSNIELVELPSAYPQGAEKMIVYSSTGRIMQEGQLPSAQGVIVMNVSTTGFLHRYMETGMPLVSRRITVDGTAVRKPCNAEVLLGTPVSDLLDFAVTEGYRKLIAGGPMMGACLCDAETPVVKTYNAILAMEEWNPPQPSACIRCGRCIRACPMDLMPAELEKAYDARDVSLLQELKVGLCMNCGSCTYVCPAHRHLSEKHQLAKSLLPRA